LNPEDCGATKGEGCLHTCCKNVKQHGPTNADVKKGGIKVAGTTISERKGAREQTCES
jgi:hypothetical protein